MTKTVRLLLFASLLLVLLASWFLSGSLFEVDSVRVLVFVLLVILSFTALFFEHYYTRPTDVIAASVSILLAMTPLRLVLHELGALYYVFYGYVAAVGVLAFFSLFLLSPLEDARSIRNTLSRALKELAVRFGNGRLLYTALVLLCLVYYSDMESPWFLAVAAYAVIIAVSGPQAGLLRLLQFVRGRTTDEIAEIFGVQSKNTFLARLVPAHNPVKRFDFVQFR